MEDSESEFIAKMKIPDYIFDLSQLASGEEPPICPVLVFINSKSGGQLGSELLKSYQCVLNPKQVYDVNDHEPDKVLHAFFNSLEKRKDDNDEVAKHILKTLRIIVAGGDGTAGWLLGIVGDLKLSHPPPIATVPLGTGNNLPFSFGWGKKNPGTDVGSVKKFLLQVRDAKPMNVDSWHVLMKLGTSSGSVDPVKLPYSLHPFKKVSESDNLHEVGTQTFRGGFWNYFSIGMDAEVSYEFHRKRQQHPEWFKKQIVNQGAYAMIGVTQGWFLANCTHPSSKNIEQLGKIKIKLRPDSRWTPLNISKRIRSIVMLNLPSFSGGLNPWGEPSDTKSKERGLTPAYVNDGLIEIVGFRDGWHGLSLLAPNGHGTRLAQAHKVRVEFSEGTADKAYMRMDGEPWLQPILKHDSPTVIEISRLGQAVMLTTDNCVSKCVPHDAGIVQCDSDTVCSPAFTVEDSAPVESVDSDSGGSSSDDSESKRKFGSADTFRITDS